MTFDEILGIPPFSLDEYEKEKLLTKRLTELTKFHSDHCPEYKRMLDSTGFEISSVQSYKDLPFLPVRLFKDFVEGRPSKKLGRVEPTYPRGYEFVDINKVLPDFVCSMIKSSMPYFGRKIFPRIF